MTRKGLCLVTITGLVTILGAASPARAQTAGNAQSFAIMGGSAVAANGIGSIVNGDVGVAPAAGTAITGFPAGATVTPPFSVRGNDSTAIAARAAIVTLNTDLGLSGPATALLPELSGQVLGPGVYSFAAAATLSNIGTGNLTLTTPGRYIFQVGAGLTQATTTHVILGAGVDPCNVWWRVVNAADLLGVNFVGNIVADAGIHLGTGVTLAGRALATANGDVTLAGTNNVGGCSIGPASPPPAPGVTDLFITKRHTGTFVVGQAATYTITVSNSGAPSGGIMTVTDVLPDGLTFVSATGLNSWACTATGQVVSCTSSASVPTGNLANPITITVMPTAAAVPTVTNRASIAGANDSNLDNNTTADITLVVLSVPTLSEWAFLMLAVLLAAAGFVALRRRTTKTTGAHV